MTVVFLNTMFPPNSFIYELPRRKEKIIKFLSLLSYGVTHLSLLFYYWNSRVRVDRPHLEQALTPAISALIPGVPIKRDFKEQNLFRPQKNTSHYFVRGPDQIISLHIETSRSRRETTHHCFDNWTNYEIHVKNFSLKILKFKRKTRWHVGIKNKDTQ